MAYYDELLFDMDAFKACFREALIQAMDAAILEVMTTVRYWTPGDKLKITPYATAADGIEYIVETENVKAFIQEFGSGERMNVSDNPGFNTYRSGDYWNPARLGLNIVGRPKGSYETPNWETGFGTMQRYSSGAMKGRYVRRGLVPHPIIDKAIERIREKTVVIFSRDYRDAIQIQINNGVFLRAERVKV